MSRSPRFDAAATHGQTRGVTRYKLTVEYDGGPFVGWQRQNNGPSVQGALEAAAAALTGAACVIHGAGRTDAGVHALGQVAHWDAPQRYGEDVVRDALNHHLRPAPIAVLRAEAVPTDFHARFSAVERQYLYRIVDRRAPLALAAGHAWRTPQKLDVAAMQAAAHVLVGRHDFTTFRDSQCQADSPVRTLDAFNVERVPGAWGRAVDAGARPASPNAGAWDALDAGAIHIRCRARSFLHRQVRSMVGALAEVGRGKWTPADVQCALEARDRAACAPVAPAAGLYLSAVLYAPPSAHAL